MTSITIRIDDELDAALARLAEEAHRTKSELVREMLRRETAVAELRRTRELLKPYADRAGYLTEDDFLNDMS